jgi:hypothetical protein
LDLVLVNDVIVGKAAPESVQVMHFGRINTAA